jgi:hypothetical protein
MALMAARRCLPTQGFYPCKIAKKKSACDLFGYFRDCRSVTFLRLAGSAGARASSQLHEAAREFLVPLVARDDPNAAFRTSPLQLFGLKHISGVVSPLLRKFLQQLLL